MMEAAAHAPAAAEGSRPDDPDDRPGIWIQSVLRSLLVVLVLVSVSGCSVLSFRRQPPPPGRTTLKSPLVDLPAHIVGNYLLLEVKWDRSGPYRFLVDTGSSVTLVTPALAKRYPSTTRSTQGTPPVKVTAANGSVTSLAAAWIRRLELGDAHFDEVPVLIHDLAGISAHLGVRVDAVLGFPLFREVLLTLDYPGSRVLLRPAREDSLVPGMPIDFDDAQKTPVIHVGLGRRSLVALIDSGSDAGFSLNPVGLEPNFIFGPRVGATVGTLAGDHTQQIGRLGDTLSISNHQFPRPIVDLTDELSSIGTGVLKYFTVTFDQQHDRVVFFRDVSEPIFMPTRRSAGISLNKTPAYWKVAGVVPGSPAEAAGIQVGDLITRINHESVAGWDLRRYEQLVSNAREIVFTFLHGNAETVKRVAVFDLVP